MGKDYNIKKLQSTDNGGFYKIDVKIPLNVFKLLTLTNVYVNI